MLRFSLILAFCAALPLVLAQDGGSTAIDFAGKVPNANAFSNGNSGINCQFIGNTECGDDTPRNGFGRDFLAAGSWTEAFCRKDSDGDGLTNGEELGDPCCVWTPGATPQRTINLSHPGLRSETNGAPKCSPSPSPSASASASAPAPSQSASTSAAPSASAGAAPATAAASPSASPVSAADTTTTTTGTGVGTGTGSGSDDSASGDSTTTGTTGTTETGGEPTAEPAPTGDASTEDSSESGAESGDDDDDGSVCFPAHATVTLEDGSNVAMRDLRVGDRVQVGAGRFSDVFMFSHKLADIKYRFVTLKAQAGVRSVSLSLTKGHFVYANGKAVPAGSVRVGDSLELMDSDSCATVTEIKSEVLAGLYNPQTVEGNIVVNGVKASTYTHSVKHVTAHCMMMPVRAAFRYLGVHLTALEGGADAIADMLPSQM